MRLIVFSVYKPGRFSAQKLFLIGLLLFALASCSKDTEEPAPQANVCGTTAKSFTTDVNPIIQASCTDAGCHGANSQNGPGPLITYSQIFNARASIRSSVSSGRMPLGGSLSSAQKNAIQCWIDNGSPEN